MSQADFDRLRAEAERRARENDEFGRQIRAAAQQKDEGVMVRLLGMLAGHYALRVTVETLHRLGRWLMYLVGF